jgi:endoglucanase
MIIVGPASWNHPRHLNNLKLPDEDRRLIVTFHYYSPFHFAHQGASWVEGSDAWKGKIRTGAPAERQAIAHDFDDAALSANQNGRPLHIGEFGAMRRQIWR